MAGNELLGTAYHFENWFDEPIKLDIVNVTQIGELVLESGFDIPLHTQICHEISFVISGDATITTDNVVMPAKKDDMHIVSKGSTHKISVTSEQQLRFAYIGFEFNNNKTYADIEDLTKFFGSAPLNLIEDKSNLKNAFLNLLNEIYSNAKYNEILLNSYVNEILVGVFRLYVKSVNGNHELKNKGHIRKFVGRTTFMVLRYVDNNILNIKGVNDVVGALNYSSSYLSHIFHQKMGMTLQQYIKNKKIEASYELLLDEKNTITQISNTLNYETVQSYCKAFKSVTGVSPTQYIKKIKNI